MKERGKTRIEFEKGSKLDPSYERVAARKLAEGNRGEESEATGPDIGPVLSLFPLPPSPSPPPTRLSGVFPPFLFLVHGCCFL